MCDSNPSVRCAADTRDKAAQSLEDYIAAWPGQTPVDAVAAARAIAHIKDAQAAGTWQPVPLRNYSDPRATALRFAGEFDVMADEAEARGDHAGATRLRTGATEYRRQAGVRPADTDISSLEARLTAAAPEKVALVGGGAPARGGVITPVRPTPPPIETYGPVDPQFGPRQAEHTWNVPERGIDQVFVTDNATGQTKVFTRREGDNYPVKPHGIRIEADRPLSNDDIRQMAGIVGYARTELRPTEIASAPYRDGPNSFVIYQDPTKSTTSNATRAYERFEDVLPRYMVEGSPERKTKDYTRAVEGVGPIEVSIWYDSVSSDRP